uniref:Vesicle transport protein n=1 Tax=Kalanchoe fedtschenkoi TaxID=63787 RepID=A0A7N0ZX87_KALFE
MFKTAQDWFQKNTASTDVEDPVEPASSSLLAKWNSYTSSWSSEEGSPFRLDLESAVRSANEKVSGAFSVVSKGVTDLPGNLQSAASTVPSPKAIMYFCIFLATGFFFIILAFLLFLPLIVLVPQKFAISFTLGCGFIVGSFFALRGPKNQFAHMISKERIPFTLAFIGSMMGTLYVSMGLHSYVLSVIFSVVQVLALIYYGVSYFPGGSMGLKFLTSTLTSSVTRCFGE